jgi:hypothetical protein
MTHTVAAIAAQMAQTGSNGCFTTWSGYCGGNGWLSEQAVAAIAA